MYSIDSKHIIIRKSDGQIVHYNPSSEKFRPANNFDLSNNNTYSEDGELIKKADQNDYDWQMATKLHRISPIYKAEELLDHHFNKTPDKVLFLKHIKYHILGYFGEPKTFRKECILRWIQSKEQTIAPPEINNRTRTRDSTSNDQPDLLKFRKHYHDQASGVCDMLLKKYEQDQSRFPSLNEHQMIECKLEGIRPKIEELQKAFSKIDISRAKSFDNDTIHLFAFLMFRDVLRARLAELTKTEEKVPSVLSKKYTHRERVIADQFLAKAGLKKEFTAKEMKSISSKRYEAFLSLTPNSRTKKFKAPSKAELEHVIQILNDSTKAQSLAIKALKSLK